MDPPRGGPGTERGRCGPDLVPARAANSSVVRSGAQLGGVTNPASTRCSSPTGEWSRTRTRTGACPREHPSHCPCSGNSWSSRSSNSCRNPSHSRIPSSSSRSRNCPYSSSTTVSSWTNRRPRHSMSRSSGGPGVARGGRRRGRVGDQRAAGEEAGAQCADGQDVAKADLHGLCALSCHLSRQPVRAGTGTMHLGSGRDRTTA